MDGEADPIVQGAKLEGGRAGHASTRTTQLYDMRHDAVTLDEIERVVI